jgi:competence protein ComEC
MRLDLRLVPPAVACWLASGLLVATPDAVIGTLVTLWLCAVTALGVMVAARRSARRQDLWGVLAVCCAAAALVTSSVAVAAPVRMPGEVRAAAGQHATVTGTLTVWSRPAETRSRGGFGGFSRRVSFRGTLTALAQGAPAEGGRSPRVSVPVLVYAEAARPGLPAPRIGSVVRVTGTLQATPPGDAAAALFFGQGPVERIAPPPWWLAWANELRARFSAAASALAGDGGDLLPGLAIGDTSAVSDELDAALKAGSLSHLTAVSGANCAVVIALVMLLGGSLRLRRGLRIALSLAILLGFVVLVTPEPSVLRSAVMASVVLLSSGAGRPGAGVPALSLVVIVLLVTDPWLSRNYGFALSVLATAGLLTLAGPLARALGRWMPGGLAALIAIPLAAQIACQPVLVLLSPTLPLYGVPANLLAAPAAPVATVIGLAACLLLPWLPGVAGSLLGAAWLPSAWIAAVARTTADLPGSRLPWLGGLLGVAATAALTLLVLALVLRRRGTRRARWPAAAIALLLAVFGTYSGSLIGGGIGRAAAFPADWQIAACDIGQGDAVVVRDLDRYALVDVGPDPKPLAACLRTLGITQINLLVLTHYDMDHIGGVEAVIGRVDTALVGIPENAQDERLHERLAEGGAVVRESARGDRGTLGRLRWEILWPVHGSPVMQVGNPGSVTIEFDGRGIRSLFLGDLGEQAQDAMRRVAAPGPVDVVKVAHHGSADQSPRLYAALGASVGIISVGADNGYGHPTRRLLDILASVGTEAVRTDLQGLAVIAPAPGGALTLWTEKVPAGRTLAPAVPGPG